MGLTGESPAVAAAKYHYLSNHIGGVDVEFMPEHDGKAWIRYAPPRWIWKGVAICAIPPNVSEAMLWGWHSNNGVMLGTPSLGFVCTKQAVAGQDGLEGYYFDHGRPLDPAERLRFAPEEEAPDFDPSKAPVLPSATWPPERLAKAHRNYAMEYARSAMREVVATFGAEKGGALMRLAFRMVGMQGYRALATAQDAPDGLRGCLAALIAAQGDRVESSGSGLVQTGWRLMDGVEGTEVFGAAYAELLLGLASGQARRHGLSVSVSAENGVTRAEMTFASPA